MSAHLLDPEQLASEARATLERSVDTKVNAVRSLVETSVAAADAEQRAVAARAAFDTAWASALGTGWTDKELRQLGLPSPAQAGPRPTHRRKSSSTTAAATSNVS